jgi:Bacterial protein of unknown function (DUF885)
LFFGCAPSTCRAVQLVSNVECRITAATPGECETCGTLDEPKIQTETDRYIAWPAQALSYKIGQLKFLELRERTRKQLGPKFDIRAFHDEMLNGGVLPLDLLDARTNRWIQAQKRLPKSVSSN